MTIEEAAARADLLVIAVKPQDIDPVLAELAPLLRPSSLVVSLCAGLPTSLFERRLPPNTPVVRVMPNTPMLVGEAMSAVSPGSHATREHVQTVTELLSCVGKVVEVPESQQDAVTALSGSGPAYFFYLVEAMIDAGILLGLPRAVAERLIVQSAVGAAKMLDEGAGHPVLLREAVTSPGGTTINAIRELENHGVRAALLAAIEAARLVGRTRPSTAAGLIQDHPGGYVPHGRCRAVLPPSGCPVSPRQASHQPRWSRYLTGARVSVPLGGKSSGTAWQRTR